MSGQNDLTPSMLAGTLVGTADGETACDTCNRRLTDGEREHPRLRTVLNDHHEQLVVVGQSGHPEPPAALREILGSSDFECRPKQPIVAVARLALSNMEGDRWLTSKFIVNFGAASG